MTSQVFEAQRNKTVLPEVGWKELQVNLFEETLSQLKKHTFGTNSLFSDFYQRNKSDISTYVVIKWKRATFFHMFPST